MDEMGKRLPLPVKEIVKTLRKSLKTERPRPRRLSDTYAIQSQRIPGVSYKPRCPLTPAGTSLTQTFFPPSCTPQPANSFKKLTVPKNMDLFTQSPGFSSHFAHSPLPSIYDQEKSADLGRFCSSSTFSNRSMDSVVSDDVCGGLDDNLEDGSLETLLTADVINTLQQTAAFNSPSELSWSVKIEPDVSLSAVGDCLSANSELTNLNMESDITIGNDIMNMKQQDSKLMNVKQQDSKLSYSHFDFCHNETTDFNTRIGLNYATLNSVTPNFVQVSDDNRRTDPTVSSSNELGFDKKSSSDVGSSYIPSLAILRNHFPPRATQPQVGVAAVIKPSLQDSVMFPRKENDLKRQTPNLHKLLSIKSEHTDLKSEIFSPSESRNMSWCYSSSVADRSVQIVPSAGAIKRTHAGFVKSEPESPKTVPRAMVKDKSTEEVWQDIQSFMQNPEDESVMSKRKRHDSGSSEHISDDDDDDESSSSGEKDNDDSDDDYSDIDADLANLKPSECESLLALGKKQKQFFWQYNVQAKGPKGTRLKLAVESPSDPHVLNNFEDPVFDVCNTAIAGIRHGGKARKGDGNEITPNPKKLFMIGHQLMRLNRQINACQLGTDVPLVRRNESRKEKNKLASRACRLKKKAQHEANKIKLYGLEQEHSQLNTVLQFIWPHIRDRARAHMRLTDKLSSTAATLTGILESQISHNLKSMIAGHTVDYVNSVILKVESGDFSGGLNIKRSQKT